MKTILRILVLGFMMTAFTAVGATSVFAQDVCTEVEAKQALYKQITDNYAGTAEKKKTAIEAGKQYVSKYGACADDKEIVTYINKSILPMEAELEKAAKQGEKDALYKRFDTAIKASNTAEILGSGKEILAKEPEFLDVIIALASAGFDQTIANPPVDTYNNDVISYSKSAIEKIEAGKTSTTGNYGVLQYSYKTKDYADGKSNALGLMNYNIGYILYYRQGKDNPAKKKEALPYFYKATQYNSFSKNNPEVYRTIGAWYLEEAIRIDGQREAVVKAAGNKDTEESLNLLGLQKGYADRAIDAYARAYKLASANKDPKNKAYADALYTKLKELYAFRYDNKTEGIDAFVATVMSKPMPDPTTDVTPVKEAAPVTPTTTSTATPGGATKSSTMTTDTTPAAQPERPAATATTTTTKTTVESNGSTKTTTTKPATKTPVKKPTPKKKGTR
ncbi:MAG: hypothetical protein LC768_13240 [Acidobacteria bacterium]|nr:hypothetical protein [Acidobacteriota bacterium]MCA1639276.1 hypothetical protein [Acidobacteriota bacterium]